jgi:rhodanese-related sulfurtransferase
MKKLFALLASAAIAASAFAGEFPDISVKEVKELIKEKKVTLIDVNGSQSYAKRHVPTALDFDAIEKDLAKHLPADKDALIVAYCGGPKCKAYQAAANAAEKLGYKNVKHMSAGISGWVDAGEKTQKAKSK